MENPKDLEAVRRVLAEHRDDIVARYHAVGTGIGRNENEYVITVYLRVAKDRPLEPVSIEGVRLNFEVTGEIRPHGLRS
ncbi:MAG: hypothetical protein M3Y07_04120 [Acidobacteriota bacterium]|nr:hypothetical protein [Acidobacteriota bacterium]